MLSTKGKGRARPERTGADLMAPARSALAPPARLRPAAGYAIAVVGTAALTALLVPLRDSLTPLSPALAFIALVVGVAWVGGFGAGAAASVLAFAQFNYFFLPPFQTFATTTGEYVVLLFVLLGISLVVSKLLARTRVRVEAAESREAELQAMQELSREMVVRMPGREAYEAVLGRLLSLLGFSAGSLCLRDESSEDLTEEVAVGAPANSLDPRSSIDSEGSPVERIPLSVGRQNLGLLLLRRDRPSLTPGESRVLRAFCDQLAIVLERDRLLRVAAKAETYRSAEKLRQALLAAVSHDLRSPLSAIKASVTDILDTEAAPGAAYHREVLESVDKEVDRLNGLIANLLDMSRIEAGMLRARIQAVDVADTISQCVEGARRRWPEMRFALSVDEQATLVRADAVFLDRVVTNLLENAARSTQEAGGQEVGIQARSGEEGRTVIRVVDHGKGVPAALREHLFHPFYELDERSPRLGPGLGLAIVKGFVVAMGGEVWVEDTPGGGATLAVSLPASLPAEPPAGREPPE